MIGMMLVSFIILYSYKIEWLILLIVVSINYFSLLRYFQKDFAIMYRQVE